MAASSSAMAAATSGTTSRLGTSSICPGSSPPSSNCPYPVLISRSTLQWCAYLGGVGGKGGGGEGGEGGVGEGAGGGVGAGEMEGTGRREGEGE